MKKVILIFAIVLLFGAQIALAQKGQPHDPNLQKDPDVQRGYDQHQKEYKEKARKDKEAPKTEVPPLKNKTYPSKTL